MQACALPRPLCPYKCNYEDYGYVADPNLRTARNAVEVLNKMPTALFFNKPSNKKYHNLCTYKQPPQGIGELLGLGHKFVIQKRKSNPQIEKVLQTLQRDIRLKYLFAGEESDNEYIKRLYIDRKSVV